MKNTTTPRIREHDATSPFPAKLPNGKYVVDEKCRCGARRSEHMDTVAYGHGACPPVSCEKFTFVEFVFATKHRAAKLETSR